MPDTASSLSVNCHAEALCLVSTLPLHASACATAKSVIAAPLLIRVLLPLLCHAHGAGERTSTHALGRGRCAGVSVWWLQSPDAHLPRQLPHTRTKLTLQMSLSTPNPKSYLQHRRPVSGGTLMKSYRGTPHHTQVLRTRRLVQSGRHSECQSWRSRWVPLHAHTGESVRQAPQPCRQDPTKKSPHQTADHARRSGALLGKLRRARYQMPR